MVHRADPAADRWDVVIVGGALSGAATALLLRRRQPALRVLILERSARFERRVGESTVEISGFFLGRVLGLTEHLNQEHLVKQGMRFWFANAAAQTLAECSETGPAYNVRFPGYQVDRAVLDEEVLARAVAAGATLRRPVRVRTIDLVPGGEQLVTWEAAGGVSGTARARWVVDASGFSALLARRHGWIVPNDAHPIAACWSRFRGVKNWDAREFAERYPAWARRAKAVRFTATNHVIGRGWWSWWIPLRGGDMSVGVVFDERLVDFPTSGDPAENLLTFLRQHPAARELLPDAVPVPGDGHVRRRCAYVANTFAGDGFVLVGDAAGFLDPFYSPGMDWISFTTTAAAALIDGCLRGRPVAERVARHNRRFTASYRRWFDAIYRDKYYYLGDHELMTLAFRLDFGCYYLGVVAPPFREGERVLAIPAFARDGAGPVAAAMRFYNRRLAAIARSRLARGTWGRRNDRRYFAFISYQLDRRLAPRVVVAILGWLRLELREGWRTWFVRPPAAEARRPDSRPAAAARA